MNAQFHPYYRTWRRAVHSIFAATLLLGATPNCHATFDLWEEQRITNDIKSEAGDAVVQLDVGRPTLVFALFHPTTPAKQKGTAILMHDFGMNANSGHPIKPLRLALSQAGWSTLSVQMPYPELNWRELPGDDLVEEARLRLVAAQKYIATVDEKPIVVIAHGYTALLALKAIALEITEPKFSALVTISLPQLNPPVIWGDTIRLLEQINIPVLDIYAEYDLEAVLTSASERKTRARYAAKRINERPELRYSPKIRNLDEKKRENVWYRQVKIANTNHFFDDEPPALTKAIWGWLDVFVDDQIKKRD